MAETLTIDQRIGRQKDELEEIRKTQLKAALGEGPAEKTIPGNRDKNYQVKESEKHLVHVAIVSKMLDEANKKFDEIHKIVKYHANLFDRVVKDNAFAEYDEVKVVHDPRPSAPKEYNLKPFDTPATAKPGANDAASAAREQKLKDTEARIDEKLAKLEALEAKLSGSAATGEGSGDADVETGKAGKQPEKKK